MYVSMKVSVIHFKVSYAAPSTQRQMVPRSHQEHPPAADPKQQSRIQEGLLYPLSNVSIPFQGVICCAKYLDGKWYRARIKSILQPQTRSSSRESKKKTKKKKKCSTLSSARSSDAESCKDETDQDGDAKSEGGVVDDEDERKSVAEGDGKDGDEEEGVKDEVEGQEVEVKGKCCF